MSITGLYTCSSCQMPVTFRSTHTNMIACAHCHSRLEKMEDGVLKLRNDIPALQDGSSPLQIGTRGVWKGKKFELIGRIRCVFDEQHTNQWTMLLEDSTMLLLAESYGHFAVYERVFSKEDLRFARVNGAEVGSGTVNILDDTPYILERRDDILLMEAEGECWWLGTNGRLRVLEVASKDRDRLVLIGRQEFSFLTFRAHYRKPEAFAFQGLRPIAADTVQKKVRCTGCNHEMPLYAYSLSRSFSCVNCGTCFDLSKGKPVFQRKSNIERKPDLPLYSTGTLQGVDYRVVGFMEKADASGYHWREYTLYNPLHGYSYLSEYNGHYIFFKEEMDAPVLMQQSMQDFTFGLFFFELYNHYSSGIAFAQGEFPGNAFNDKYLKCREYIAPPEIWSCERHSEGLIWFHGEHISQRELQKAFAGVQLPAQIGVGAVQPVKFSANFDFMQLSALVAVLVLFLSFMVSTLFNKERVLYENTIELVDSTRHGYIVTSPLVLEKRRSNLLFEIEAPVDNTWFEASFTLVDVDNGNEFGVDKGVEYYWGYSEGEKWSEGSYRDDVIMHSIPRGKYILRILPASEMGRTPRYFNVKVTYDVPMWHNFWMLVLLALGPLVVVYLYSKHKETLRWQNSAYPKPTLYELLSKNNG